MIKNTCSLIAAMLLLTACPHEYESVPEGGLKFEEDLAIKEPIVLRNGYSEKGKIVFDALSESGYFTTIYREDDKMVPKPKFEFDIKLDRDRIEGGGQEVTRFVSLLTLGGAPTQISFNYTLNTGVWKNGKFLNRYKPVLESSNTIVAWQMIKAEEKSLIKQLLPDILRQLKADLAKK